MVVFLRSWKRIADTSGIEAIDFAETAFLNLCRFATRDASAHARLSVTVFAALWPASGAARYPGEVFARWLPMDVSTPSHSVSIDAGWLVTPIERDEQAHDVFDRVVAEIESGMAGVPENERFDQLFGGWDRQV